LSIMTACPCTLAFSRLRTLEDLRVRLGPAFDRAAEAAIPPTFTHSQRGLLTVTVVSRDSSDLELRELYRQISRVTHPVQSVLKRPDEHNLVRKAHLRPQFCEDVCRAVAVSAASILQASDDIEVSVELDESIHPHKAYASLSAKASMLWLNRGDFYV
jgi:GTP cyclohydrolase FolE2